MFMNLALFKSTTVEKLEFQFQQIVDAGKRNQNWVEMLYRPNSTQHIDVDEYFKSLTESQAIELDCKIFSEIPLILKQQSPRRLSVNLMPESLNSPQFQTHLRDLLQSDALDPSRMCIEIVETHSLPFVSNDAFNLLSRFRNMGGLVALDDFGTGYSHWELLQQSLIDVIKVANQNITGKDHSRYIHGLAKFAESMDIATVLEGIETQQDFYLGLAQGFNHFQGWYFK